MKIDEEIYKGFVIESHYNEESKLFYATSTIANSVNSYYEELKNRCRGFLTPKEAVNNVILKIDAFLEITPKNYSELATAITDSLVRDSYEDSHADEFIIQKLVERFIKTQNSWKKVPNKLRVAHYPNIPCKPFIVDVKDEEEAYKIETTLANQHLFLFENNFIPDYSNVILVQMWDEEEQDWLDYWNEEEMMEWDEFVEEYLKQL